MIINHNMQAINAHRQMGSNQVNAQKSMEKLSSGLRINRAGDDAAGLAISEKMRGQIRGLDQASRNAQDGISLIQTAEGALNETHSILQRMRELSVQSANDTNTDDDRKELQKEVKQLTEEIDRIANTTEFNTKKLLNGDLGIAANTKDVREVGELGEGTYKVAVTGAATKGTVSSVAGTDTAGGKIEIEVEIAGEKHTITASGDTIGDLATSLQAGLTAKGVQLTVAEDAKKLKFTAGEFGQDAKITIKDSNVTGLAAGTALNLDSTEAVAKLQKLNSDGTGYSDVATGITINNNILENNGTVIKLDNAKLNATADALSFVVNDKSANLHIGANEGQNMSINIGAIDSNSLGTAETSIKEINLESSKGADSAIKVIDAAMKQVSAQRSQLGAFQNRLEHTINNLGTSSENLTSAESRIRDVDMAKEMMAMSKNNILQQASQAMLAQANQAPQQVLQLLR
ncbi:flagellin N-terminal helical domain-containing protein [Niameybacter massiliensis]|uniref:flagellin N-terminal helical domain-containing protein n=1 Tax=Niameybacter massiliensis TaxID=1658108 RepID=UPI0006B4DC2B|nr:flagellin [Niameybacter massiliensis]